MNKYKIMPQTPEDPCHRLALEEGPEPYLGTTKISFTQQPDKKM